MTRRSYRYNAERDEMVELTTSWSRKEAQSAYVQPDITPFLSPIDGTIISSRGGLRRHMKKHDVVNTSDYKEHTAKAAKEREMRNNGTHPALIAERKRTISDACEHVRNQRIADGSWKRLLITFSGHSIPETALGERRWLIQFALL